MKSINVIKEFENGNKQLLKDNKWLMHLAYTKDQNINYEHLISMSQLKENRLLLYVKDTLNILEDYDLNQEIYDLVEATLSWSEVAKGGMDHQRKKWLQEGHNLFVHNLGSSTIYGTDSVDNNPVIEILIRTHGLVGQYVRGEVPLNHSNDLLRLVDEYNINKEDLTALLNVLNHCIIGGVSLELWEEVHDSVEEAIDQLLNGSVVGRVPKERLKLLRGKSILAGEDFELCFEKESTDIDVIGFSLPEVLDNLLSNREIWYFEAALQDFSFQEVIKLMLIINNDTNNKSVKHISFENIMKNMYYDYGDKKKVNLYSKRIVENYLSELSYEEILGGLFESNPHLNISCSAKDVCEDTIFVGFDFSPPANKLIEFCVEAERASVGYERAIVLLYDYFGLRKDKYDRFHNEESYLKTMNQSIDYKSVILDYITGTKVIDIGPGGGALMDLIEENKPDVEVLGIDISSNVIDTLKKKKHQENKKWDVQFGDALDLQKDVEIGSVDSIIFCSIIHELYSYIEVDGKGFNHSIVRKALESAFNVLAPGGRIIIRDGIMTEPENQYRLIEFASSEGMEFLERYAKDFKGRDINYIKEGHKTVKMLVNDAMEFLYTYTWGEDSYAHEINEQFGYFTPTKYKNFIEDIVGDQGELIVEEHYLQEGYTTALEPKVKIYDEEGKPCSLPDSTCLIVIQKNK